MKIVYIGAVKFSLLAVERLIEIGANIVGICAIKESAFNADHADISVVGNDKNIPWIYINDINSADTIDWIASKSPDIIFCFGWSKLIKRDLLSIPRLGVLGFHPSLLPKNRGRHPLIWPIVLGLEEVGSTFFFMDEGADSGDIISQRSLTIHPDDDVGDVYRNVTNSALDQIDDFFPKLLASSFVKKQQDPSLANYWRKRTARDGLVDWRMSANSIHNLVRALAKPYAGASFFFNGIEVKIWKTKIIQNYPNNIEPGKIVGDEDGLPIIKCGEDSICLLSTSQKLDFKNGEYL